MNLIISKIGLPAALEQLAEEAAELSKAALKVARIIRKENPTPVTYEQAIANLEEEAADVRNCLRVVCGELDINIGWAMLIFLCAYLSNVAFSLFYNIKILLQPFNRDKAINSALKVAAFLIGLTLLCVAITTLPLYANQIGWAIPEEYSDLFADLIILGAVLVVSCKYIMEAFTKFKKILEYKGEP